MHIWSLIFYRPSNLKILEMSVRDANLSHSLTTHWTWCDFGIVAPWYDTHFYTHTPSLEIGGHRSQQLKDWGFVSNKGQFVKNSSV